jgi:hypothetical protein
VPATSESIPFIDCDAVLRIAHLDATKAYRDLRPYRITMALEPDGWHVD